MSKCRIVNFKNKATKVGKNWRLLVRCRAASIRGQASVKLAATALETLYEMDDALSALLDGSEELASGQRANVAVEVAGEGDSQSNNHSRQAVQ